MTAFTTVKIAVLAPIPRASVRMVTAAKAGARTRLRAAVRRSWRTTSRAIPSFDGGQGEKVVRRLSNRARAGSGRALTHRLRIDPGALQQHLEAGLVDGLD